MKTLDLSAGLLALAPLADKNCMEELRSLASLFECGKEETVAARLKRIPAGHGLPESLRSSLTAIETMLNAFGAKKQAGDITAMLSKFSGSSYGTADEFIAQFKVAVEPPRSRAAGNNRTPPAPDKTLARQLADDLTRTVLDNASFSRIVERLEDKKVVSTPTLAMIGNIFLGNSKEYKGRKPVITDILKRQGEEILDNSRRTAVKKAG